MKRPSKSALNPRYEAYLSSGSTEMYPLWNQAQIQRWALESGRTPELVPWACHDEYDAWLLEQFPISQES